MATEYLFVYGLLMEGYENSFSILLHHNSKCLGTGWTRGKLYDIGAYPGLVTSGATNDKVKGKVYEIVNPEILSELDHFEGIGDDYLKPHEYIRKKMTVTSGEEEFDCWVYVYNWSVDEGQVIDSGDYQQYMEDKKMRS